MRWLWKAYQTALHFHPRITQSLQTGLLISTGDTLSQVFVEEKPVKNLNHKRTLQYFTVGTFYVGPALSVWYKMLHTYVGNSGKKVALVKVVLDQTVFAPSCLMGLLFVLGGLQGKTLEGIKETIRKIYLDILLTSYKIWPPVQLINFYFVPLHFQALYAQIIALLWNIYMCYKTKPDD